LQGIAQKNFIFNTQKDDEDNKKGVLDSKFTTRMGFGHKTPIQVRKNETD
jgi:hypothetical protein